MTDRPTRLLDGIWQFRHGDGPLREAQVPMPWQAQFADLRQSSGVAVYQRWFDAPLLGAGQVTFLMFGAVSYHADVRLNGVDFSRHRISTAAEQAGLLAALLDGQRAALKPRPASGVQTPAPAPDAPAPVQTVLTAPDATRPGAPESPTSG